MDLLTVGAVGDPPLSEKMGPWLNAGDASPAPPHQVNAAGAVVELPDEDGLVLARAVGDRLKREVSEPIGSVPRRLAERSSSSASKCSRLVRSDS